MKTILGDYGTFHTAALQRGCNHESEAIQLYTMYTEIDVKECGVFLSKEYPYLATSPDGIFHLTDDEFSVIEVKCPYKHCDNTIWDACNDKEFCLYTDENGLQQLKQTHDYYFQVIGQITLTGAQFCDFILWTNLEYMSKESFQIMNYGMKWQQHLLIFIIQR